MNNASQYIHTGDGAKNALFEKDVIRADAVILGSHVVNANVKPKTNFLRSWLTFEELSSAQAKDSQQARS
ncbi:unnamed protein product [Peronospora belbahrii]|uniref:Uncharacterized protein n=1 Tax=Peronospora belbahrii TaxID=622444 RepID=A0AAU9LB89_9STRA|nr:unnamed protein product [Peronospora belbahrii]